MRETGDDSAQSGSFGRSRDTASDDVGTKYYTPVLPSVHTMNVPARFDHPAWTAGVATVVSYGLGLFGLFVLLFVLPYLLFLLV